MSKWIGALVLSLALAGSAHAADYYAFEQITIANTAIGLTASTINAGNGHSQASQAVCRVETAEIRYRLDGTAPTSAVGTLLEIGDTLVIADPVAMRQFSAIRTTGSSGTLSCSYASGNPPPPASISPNASISATISGSNPAASTTGTSVPAFAGNTGVNVSGTLRGLTGLSVGSIFPATVAIVDGSGAQITSFGGGTQYATGSAQATPTGTVALGWDGANVRALSTNSSGVLTINPGNTANTTAWLFAGGKTNNNAAPGATNVGVLPALANASAPSWTEGNEVNASVDLHGSERVTVMTAAGAAQTFATDSTAGATAGTTGPQVMLNGVTAEPTAVTTGQATPFTGDLVGKLVTSPYAISDLLVSGVTAAMTGTTSTSIVSAPASGLRNYLTQLTCTNSHATVGTFVLVQDGSGGTTIYEAYAAAVGGGFALSFPAPLRQPTTATALFVQDVTTGANVICSASGYKGR